MAETTNKEEEEDTGLEMRQTHLEPPICFFPPSFISLLMTIYKLTMGRMTSTSLPLSTPPLTNTFQQYPGAPKKGLKRCISWARGLKHVCKHVLSPQYVIFFSIFFFY